MNLEDYIKDLAPDLQEKARACGSVEELLRLPRKPKLPCRTMPLRPLLAVICRAPRTASQIIPNARNAVART